MSTPEQPPPPPAAPPPSGTERPGTPGIGIAGFVVGLIGLLISWVFIAGLVVCIIGIVLSILGRRQAAERNAPSGLPTAGLICGIIGAVIAVIITIVVVVAVEETDDLLDDITFTTTNFVVGWHLLRQRGALARSEG